MKTIKLPIKIKETDIELLKNIQRECSSLFRWSFNRYQDSINEKTQRNLFSNLNYEYLDSWLVQSIITEAKASYDSFLTFNTTKNPCFGSKSLFNKYLQKKISKEELKDARLHRIVSIGEACRYGNRKFKLENNKVIFKYCVGNHIELELPKLRKNLQKELNLLEIAMKENILAVQVCFSPNKSQIYITFDEKKLYENIKVDVIKNRVLGIDLNPDYIGYSISDISTNNEKVIDHGTFDLKEMQEKLTKKGFRNKFNYENIEICHELKKKFDYFKCEKVVIEDLKFDTKSLNNKNLNRKCKNQFNYSQVASKLKMLFGAKLVEINPVYTSLIGNLKYNFHDPVNASLEIARRGNYKFIRGMFYPSISGLKLQWKQILSPQAKTWKDISEQIKNSGLRYRVQLVDINVSCFEWKSIRSKVKHIKSK